MTTFHAPHNHRTLTIGQHADGSGITFHTEDGSASVGVYLDPADSPAIALAVLDAAGIEPELHEHPDIPDLTAAQLAETGAWYLRKSVKRAESESKDRAEEAELEADAEELFSAFTLAGGTWATVHGDHRKRWVAAARRARELAKERAK